MASRKKIMAIFWLNKGYLKVFLRLFSGYLFLILWSKPDLTGPDREAACDMERDTGMGTKKTMTLNLKEAEMRVLEELSTKKDLSKTALLRQALRMYQLVEMRLEKGDKLFFEDERTKEKAEVMML